MTPRILIDTASIPGGADMQLFSRGGDFMIVVDRNELMSTRMNGSEIALATLALERIAGVKAPKVLIGGYGMGFTLRAVLGAVGPGAVVTVAELVPEIIAWARGPMAAVAAGCLDDPRVVVVEGDVADVIRANGFEGGGFDAILLDVDNGPDGLVRAENDRLYAPRGLAVAKAALAPGGVLAVWSAGPDAKFVRRLGAAGFAVEEIAVKARTNGKGPRHVIWFATVR
ncbi:spermidine synthase [Sphingomonas sp. HMP6]|uniref:spermidine synthase n=1 Tax=Sphingomonas sp. HMP6 TaxID=1517551 RepID=UPI001596A9DF|nr:spermidine synthase [Sphingomonas sp. HMP6]BCA59609.1 spermidine synthase [Sphingomonas sp. HMP6]